MNSTSLERLSDRITVRQYGRSSFIKRPPDRADVQLAQRGLAECTEIILAGKYRLVILDEANIAMLLGLFPVEDLMGLI